jgi:hypothetical protein
VALTLALVDSTSLQLSAADGAGGGGSMDGKNSRARICAIYQFVLTKNVDSI